MEWPADKIERKSVSALVPYARNARTHSDEQVAQLAASIKEWGWTMPVLIDEENGIIAGHGRVLAAQKLGIDEVPTMTAKGWSEPQKRAYVIADNQLTLNGDWNEDLLSVEVGELSAADFDLKLLAFDADRLSQIMFDPDNVQPNTEGPPRLDEFVPVVCPNCGHEFEK